MVRLAENKHASENKPTEKLPLPKKVYLPLIQHLGKICEPLVKVGDTVELGEKIAEAFAQPGAPVHASISGKVTGIIDWPHPVLGTEKAVVIESDGSDDQEKFVLNNRGQVGKLGAQELRNIVSQAGIVGMGGASFPTYIKLDPVNPLDAFILNGAECEPYLTADARLMVEKTAEIVSAAQLISAALGIKNIYIGIEKNKPEAIKAFNGFAGIKVVALPADYPQGGEKQLIRSILGKEVPRGKLPFSIGALVQNVATVYAIYEAVYKHKPLIERIVTVSGNCLQNPRNLLVRIGTPVKELIDFCGPLVRPAAKIIIGGPMMGIAQSTTDVPVIKSSGGVILLDQKAARETQEEGCIRCGACIRGCPVGLLPCQINLASEKKLWKMTKELGASDCIECGLCNYLCPASRSLVQSIKKAKTQIIKTCPPEREKR